MVGSSDTSSTDSPIAKVSMMKPQVKRDGSKGRQCNGEQVWSSVGFGGSRFSS